VRVRLLYFDGCPSWRQAADHLDILRAEFDLHIEHQLVETPEAAVRAGFHGSPSIVVDDHDLFPTHEAEVGLSCRIYQTLDGPSGSPTLDQTRAALHTRHERDVVGRNG
jgi:hypothetical protein